MENMKQEDAILVNERHDCDAQSGSKAQQPEENKTKTGRYSVKDKGWAWIIALGFYIHVFIFVGIGKSYGLFFVEFLKAYDTNSSTLSIMISAQNLVISIMSIIVLNLGVRHFQGRHLFYGGTVLLSVAYIINGYVPGEAGLIISQGVIYGVGVAMTTLVITVELNKYFEKKLGFAFMIAGSGASVGSFVFPFIIRKLLDDYGLQGTLLVMAGTLMHNFIVGALLRPFRTKTDLEEVNVESLSPDNGNELDNVDITYSKRISKSAEYIATYYSSTNLDKSRDTDAAYYKLVTKPSKRVRSISENGNYYEVKQDRNTSQSFSTKLGASGDIYPQFGTVAITSSVISLNPPTKTKPTLNSENVNESKPGCCSKIFDFSLLKNRHLLLIFFACQTCVAGCGLIVLYIPPFAEDNHISNEQIAILATIMGVCEFVSRTSFSFLMDRIRPSVILAICLALTGIATMLCPLLTTFYTFLPYCIIYGFFGSIYFSISPVIIRQCVGGEKYPQALSIQVQIHSIAFVGFTPLLGMARDMTGSYILTFYIMGAGILIGAVAMLCEPIFERMERNRQKREEQSQ